MNIIVFADSHGDTETMETVVTTEQPDMVLHLGDHLADALKLHGLFPGIPMEFVKGNTDVSAVWDTEKLITAGNVPIFMTHGDTYEVQDGIHALIAAGKVAGASIILFGHTHSAYLERQNGIWVMNPGRIGCFSCKHIDATYGLIRINKAAIHCEIIPFI